MGAAVNGVYADVKLRTARVKISQALLRLNAIKPGNEANYIAGLQYYVILNKRPWARGTHGPEIEAGTYMEKPREPHRIIKHGVGWALTRRSTLTRDSTVQALLHHAPEENITEHSRSEM